MSQPVDPLFVLCDCIRQGSMIQILPDGIRLGRYTFGLDTLVGVLQFNSTKHYSLLVCVYAYFHRDKSLADYIKECLKLKVERVHSSDRRNLLAYLEDQSTPIPGIVTPILTVPLAEVESDETQGAKKRKLEEVQKSTDQSGDRGRANDLTSLFSMERTHKSRSTILMTNKTLDRVSAIIENVEKQDGSQSRRSEKEQGNPIIIVPAGLSSNITLWNVKQFLQDGVYMTIQEVKKNSPNKPEQPVILQYTRGGKSIMFHVYDSPQKLTEENWKNVVAVFTTGKEWELERFTPNNPASIFSAYRGFHLALDNDKPEGSVPQWNVKVIRVSRTASKRYLDGKSRTEFWAELDLFMTSKFPQFFR